MLGAFSINSGIYRVTVFEKLEFSFDIPIFLNEVKRINPQFIFNLVETVDGKSALLYLAPSILDCYNFQYTGCSAKTLYVTTDKILTKNLFKAFQIPTPMWVYKNNIDFIPNIPYIIKAVNEEASIGIDKNSVQTFRTLTELTAVLEQKKAEFQLDFFAEQYIEGREFNISLLESADGCDIMSPAEMIFAPTLKSKYKIVDYKSKWDETSDEYKGTERTFELKKSDEKLINEIKAISKKCWETFELSGYARVDLRVDNNNKPYILEINANPCISPDSGFIAACKQNGLSIDDIILRIIDKVK